MSDYFWPPSHALAPRLAPAWDAVVEAIADGMWHDRQVLRGIALDASDLAPKTVSGLLRQGVKYGQFEQRGTYPHQEVRLGGRGNK